MISWKTLTASPSLTESRLQLHYAIQFIAATGAALAEPLPDYSHTSLEWQPDLALFTGVFIRSQQSFRIAIEPIRLTLMVLDQQNQTIASLPLSGKRLTDGLDWLKQEIANLGKNADAIQFLDYPPDDFPDHAIAHGAPFQSTADLTLSALVNYYANTHSLIQAIVNTTAKASAMHIWPHHFDMASLITLPGMKEGSPLTVGVGVSPGDTSYNEPYWYVSPYPYPELTNLPALEGKGFWHTQHWVGAVLTASQVTEIESEQQPQVESFLNSAIKASIAMLGIDAAEWIEDRQ
ncbi:MAG: hypothetical protein KME16_25885 [Scytolyngbya sp. HA4215-MV1]|nr:hypothetical protein [Scytolyngbya sp. HA4215-MV1]